MSDLDTTTSPADADNAGIAVPGEALPVESSAPVAEGGDDAPSEIETRAKAMGWVPKDQFRGPAENWRDADEFVRRGEEELPIVRERNRELTRKLADFEGKLAQMGQTYEQRIAALDRMNTLALTKQRDQLAQNYNAALRQAAEVGDLQRYDQLRADYGQALHDFDSQITTVRQPPPVQPQMPKLNEKGFIALPQEAEVARETWLAQNQWFDSDPELNAVAQHVHMRLNKEKPGISLQENLNEVTRYVRQRYPEKFGTPRQQAPAVEGGGRLPASNTRRRGVNDLPSDARRQAEKFVREGLFKDVNAYAAEYFAQES